MARGALTAEEESDDWHQQGQRGSTVRTMPLLKNKKQDLAG